MAKIFIEESTLSAIGNSIRAKTGKTNMIPPLNMPTEIESIQTGGGSSTVTTDDVNFYDYDGTLVASYSLSEAQALTALPDGPTHEGLIFQGWNYTLEKVKAFTRSMNVGATYTTNDGKTRIYITLGEGRTSPLLGCCPNGTVIVDWGDGTTPDTLTGTSTSVIQYTPTHNYTSPGSYVISLTVNGTCGFLGSYIGNDYCYLLKYSTTADTRNRYYQNAITKIEIGDSVTSIGNYTFQNCYSLISVTIPDSVTSIENNLFSGCESLISVTIPDSVTSIGGYAFDGCCSITSVIIPDSVTGIGENAFGACYSLISVTIPDSVTSIGGYAFGCCESLISVTIPDSVTSIENELFSGCYLLTSLIIPNRVTSIGYEAFSGCYSLTSVIIPDSVTSIGENAFGGCHSLTSFTISDNVTSIENELFSSCESLTSLIIPDRVTSIGIGAFSSCYGMAEYHLKPTAPPALSNTNAFNYIPSDCIIYVPQGSLNAYKTATNWATYASHMQEETT